MKEIIRNPYGSTLVVRCLNDDGRIFIGAWEPLREGVRYRKTREIDGVACGRIGTKRPAPELAGEALREFWGTEFRRAYEALEAAFPDEYDRGTKVDGELILFDPNAVPRTPPPNASGRFSLTMPEPAGRRGKRK